MDIKPGCAKVSCNFRKTELITCLQFNKKPVSLILHLWGNVSQKTKIESIFAIWLSNLKNVAAELNNYNY